MLLVLAVNIYIFETNNDARYVPLIVLPGRLIDKRLTTTNAMCVCECFLFRLKSVVIRQIIYKNHVRMRTCSDLKKKQKKKTRKITDSIKCV